MSAHSQGSEGRAPRALHSAPLLDACLHCTVSLKAIALCAQYTSGDLQLHRPALAEACIYLHCVFAPQARGHSSR